MYHQPKEKDSRSFVNVFGSESALLKCQSLGREHEAESKIEVTELRFWKVCLNNQIISENYKMPLALLNEQKRKIKVDINKKKKFSTNVARLGGLKSKLAAVSKLGGKKSII